MKIKAEKGKKYLKRIKHVEKNEKNELKNKNKIKKGFYRKNINTKKRSAQVSKNNVL